MSDKTNETIFADRHGLSVVAQPNSKNIFDDIKNSTIKIDCSTRILRLSNCTNINIICTRLPAMGMHLCHCTDITIHIGDNSDGKESGYIDLDGVIIGKLTSYRPVRIEINRSSDIMFNGTNISDEYTDSTWELT